jgi:hypothetical protein
LIKTTVPTDFAYATDQMTKKNRNLWKRNAEEPGGFLNGVFVQFIHF